MVELIYPAKSTTKITMWNYHMEACPLQTGTMTDSANNSDPRVQSVTQKFKCCFLPIPEHPSHTQDIPLLSWERGGILTFSKVPWFPSALDTGQQNI